MPFYLSTCESAISMRMRAKFILASSKQNTRCLGYEHIQIMFHLKKLYLLSSATFALSYQFGANQTIRRPYRYILFIILTRKGMVIHTSEQFQQNSGGRQRHGS